jgi:uncharacterized protein YbjT (DUF2867 family)
MADSPRTVLVLGATGLVGREVVHQLLADPAVGEVVALTRRPIAGVRSPKLRNEVLDFDSLSDHASLFAVDQVFCALGTTIKQAGSQAAFRHVDHDIPLAAATLGVRQGVKDFLLVSALGASAASRVFYNRVKGELEDALRTLGFRSLTIARPSLLVGKRDNPRLGEQIGARLGWLVPGKYKPVNASRVAAALVDAARRAEPGMRIIESDEIQRIPVEHE